MLIIVNKERQIKYDYDYNKNMNSILIQNPVLAARNLFGD